MEANEISELINKRIDEYRKFIDYICDEYEKERAYLFFADEFSPKAFIDLKDKFKGIISEGINEAFRDINKIYEERGYKV